MSRTALVVDDSISMRKLVAATLRSAGLIVHESENGREALDRLSVSSVDLVITDLNMPVMDGLALVRAVRTTSKHRLVPILLLTTETSAQKKAAAKAAGATGWLAKPFNPQQLLQVLARVLP